MKALIPNKTLRWSLYAIVGAVQYYLMWRLYRAVAEEQGIAHPWASYCVLVGMLLYTAWVLGAFGVDPRPPSVEPVDEPEAASDFDPDITIRLPVTDPVVSAQSPEGANFRAEPAGADVVGARELAHTTAEVANES